MTRKKTKCKNPVRCMTYKDKDAFSHRLCTRKAFLGMIINKTGQPPYMKPLENLFDISDDDVSYVQKKSRITEACMGAPHYKACRNPLLCEECLSMWRYKLVKTLERNAEPGKLYFLIKRNHDFIMPRGLIKGAYGRPEDLTYLLSDSFGTDGNWGLRFTHPLAKFQEPAGRIFDAKDRNNALGFAEKNFNDFYSIYQSAVLPRSDRMMPIFLDNVLEGPILVSSVPFHMAMEQSYATNLSDNFGGAFRRTFRLVDDNSLLCLSLQSLIVSVRPFDEFSRIVQSRLTHSSKQLITEYTTPVYNSSDMYVSNRITIENYMYMSDADTSKTLRFVEGVFPYNQTIDNMTPIEFVLCYQGLYKSKKHFSSCGGILRDDGKTTE